MKNFSFFLLDFLCNFPYIKKRLFIFIGCGYTMENFNNFISKVYMQYEVNMGLDDGGETLCETQSLWFGTGEFYKISSALER